MDMNTWKPILWQQFGASIDMLENAVTDCPEEIWSDRTLTPECWYLVFHTLFWMDLYLSGPIEGFTPPPPFKLDELDPEGLLPERIYSKEELLTYLAHGREKCRTTIENLTEEKANQRLTFPWGEVSFAELLLYNMRHVQHGAAQMNLVLRQKIDSAPRWICKTNN